MKNTGIFELCKNTICKIYFLTSRNKEGQNQFAGTNKKKKSNQHDTW